MQPARNQPVRHLRCRGRKTKATYQRAPGALTPCCPCPSAQALKMEKLIVPVYKEDFQFPGAAICRSGDTELA